MKRSNLHKSWFYLISAISLIATVIFKFADNWFSIENSICKELLDFGYDIFLSIIIVLIASYAIDRVIQKRKDDEEKSRKKILYSRVLFELKDFYGLYIDIFAGTRAKPINKSDAVLTNLFINKEEFYSDVLEHINILGTSPYLNGAKINLDSSTCYDFDNLSEEFYIRWDRYILKKYLKLKQTLNDFRLNFSHIATANVVGCIDSLYDSISFTEFNVSEIGKKLIDLSKKGNVKQYIEILRFKEIMSKFEDLMKAFSEEIGENLLKIDIEIINNKNVHPLLGELIKTK